MRITSGSLTQAVSLEATAPPEPPSRALTLLCIASVVAYGALCWPLSRIMGESAFLLSFLSIILVGTYRGPVWGALAAVVTAAINVVVASAQEHLPVVDIVARGFAGILSGVVVGVGVGHLKDMSRRLAHELREKERIQEAARFLAFHDPVTGLPNRVLLTDRLRLELAHAQRDNTRVAIMFVDVDNFKKVNDTLGHVVGDELLEKIATQLRGCLRKSDTVARFGGDEFVLVLPGLQTEDNVSSIAAKVLRLQDHPIEVAGNRRVFVTFSMGVAVYPGDGEDFDALLKNADTAMNRAKADGRRRLCIFNPAMNANAASRLELEADLRHAVERNELVVFYQPQIDPGSNMVIGLEALVRWKHTERGLISPALFIPLAEETGVIQEIGTWVLEESCKQLRRFQDLGYKGLRMAVNLSPVQLRDAGCVDCVDAILQRTGVAPSDLELEITEAVLMQGDSNCREHLARLRGMGIQLAIDDFGTGYSSLAYLKRFRVDALKIDRSFVMDMGTDDNSETIVRAMIAIAHALGLRTVAEGVETDEQRLRLKGLGVDEMQGFFFSKPLPANEVQAQLTKGDVTRATPAPDRAAV
ncbi:MAG: EAL domain-containing protein [Deltaproteobacteria bacterium]|nr:EAL domain-containing protein [Deltaproteobacteria bacterium]